MSNVRYIGIETIFRDVLLVNYGSIFQHYALRSVLKALEFKVFRCEHDSSKAELRSVLFPLRWFRWWLLFVLRLRGRPDKNLVNAGWLRLKFILDYWRLIGRIFETQPKCPPYAYIAGGDSVWCRTVRSDYLLDKPSGCHRLSYAASSAWDKCSANPNWRNIIKEVAETFKAIAVREQAGVDTIRCIVPSANVTVVLDPVMLLPSDQLLNVVRSHRQQFKRSTLLYYAVNVWEPNALNLEVIEGVSRSLDVDLRIVGIQGAENYIPKKYALRPSPRQFLAMVRDADYFVTNSFHGVVFSLVLQKRFAFIAQGARRFGDQNCRQRELLNRFSLEDRMLSAHPRAVELEGVLSKSWDVERVTQAIEAERDRCIVWLKEALDATR